MALLLAAIAMVSIGASEFIASDATKRARSHEVTSMFFVTGTIATAVIALFWPGDPTTRDLAFGAIGGLANGVGILLLYAAYSRGSLRSAAPSAAVVMTAVPVIWDVVAAGGAPPALIGVGLIVGVMAIGLTSYRNDQDGHDDARGALPIALAGGVVFGVLFILLGEIEAGAGGLPIVLQRAVGLVVAVVATRATGPRILPEHRGDRVRSGIIGLLATASVVLVVLALQLGGSLSTVSVLSSQYAAVAVVLGVVLRNERLNPAQSAGLVLASISVVFITLG